MPRFVLPGGALLAVAAAVLAACTQPADDKKADANPAQTSVSASPTPDRGSKYPVAALLRRPLRLPSVRPREPCPVTRMRPAPSPRPPDEMLVGSGPAFPVGFYFGEATVLTVRSQDRDEDGLHWKKGWYWAKVPWVVVGYEGPVLIRAGRIDGPGAAGVRFFDTGRRVGDGVVVDVTLPSSTLPGATGMQGPGCYAYKVDGTDFSYSIVFRVIIAPGQ
jgi:hypothetical protein